jgi:hypothetical protein
MTEAGGGGSRVEVERMIRRSLEDDSFRQRLLDDPRGTLEQELGRRLPEGVEVSAGGDGGHHLPGASQHICGRRRRRDLRRGARCGGRRHRYKYRQ